MTFLRAIEIKVKKSDEKGKESSKENEKVRAQKDKNIVKRREEDRTMFI